MKVALPQIRCQLHDHAKQYDNDGECHNKWNGGKLHGNILYLLIGGTIQVTTLILEVKKYRP